MPATRTLCSAMGRPISLRRLATLPRSALPHFHFSRPRLGTCAARQCGVAAAAGRQQVVRAFASSEGKAPDEPEPQMRKVSENVQFTWKSAVFTCLIGGFCIWYYDYLKDKKESESRAITTQERIGVPRLGGPFELVDRKGNTVTDKDFLGQYLLIYFGFTFCPDICPQEMEKQTQAIEQIEAEFGPIATPVFISVDPKRDLPAIVDDYCKEFHPRIVGLTGTPEQVKKVSRAYRVYYNEGLKTDDADYLVDHSIIHYFIGKNGKFLDFFGKNMTSKEMADKMKGYIRQDQENSKQRKQRHGVASTDEE